MNEVRGRRHVSSRGELARDNIDERVGEVFEIYVVF